MKLEAAWTDDCQGKKDYDANLVRLSTRYWPRGGGFSLFYEKTNTWEDNEARPEIRPSASVKILLQEETIAKSDFEADTEDEVKTLVEHWAQEQFDKIHKSMRSAFPLIE